MQSVKFWTLFVLLEKSLLPHLEWKFIVIELLVTFLSFGCLYLGKWSVIFQAGFPHIYKFTATPWFVCLLYSLPSNIFYWVLFSFYRTPEDRTKLPLKSHSWKKTIYLKLIALCRLFEVQLLSFSRCAVLFCQATKNYPISSFWMV